jgi:hyperosmotically inducible protein
MPVLFSYAVNQQEVAVRCCYGILLLGLFAGCMESAPVKTSNTDNPDNTSHTVNKPVVNDSGPVPATPRDNTAINERDQNSAVKTPFDQGNNESDVNITAEIRQRIVNHKGANDEGMSINARNVKIITEGKHVTLRGPVSNADEKTMIEKFAKEVAGPSNVTNQLEVAP